MNLDPWLLYPLAALAGGIVALIPLGRQVLRRGVVFIDLAVAQGAAVAVIWFDLLHSHEVHALDQLAASAGALAICLAVAWLAKAWTAQREGLIGLLYVSSASLSLLGSSLHPHGKEKLLDLLAADVLWVEPGRAWGMGLMAVLMLLVQRFRSHWLSRDLVFYALFALVVSAAVPALGLFLVFTGLISPALWIERGWTYPRAALAAVLVAVLGMLLSWQLDLPSGPTIALALTLFGLASALAPGKRQAR